MSRPFRAPALAAIALCAVTGCQDYNFNPVGHCLIQPGSKTFTLSSVDTADILFVVDDSGSMAAEQGRLADAFSVFVANLSNTNDLRKAQGLEPFGYHVAVTTTSVYWNYDAGTTCTSACPGASGQAVCCAGTAPARQPKRCSSSDQCAGGTQCLDTCAGWKGELVCCTGPGAVPPATELISCSREGIGCGSLETHYAFNSACTLGTAPNGVAVNEWPYPHGSFVGQTTTTPVRPRVLHFDKRLYGTDAKNAQGLDRATLEQYFTDNVKVGICGSGQEQALQAGRLALESAFAGQQKDTWTFDPNAAGTATVAWNGDPTSHPNPAAPQAVWPNPNSKLVLVFVGDEDDCSSPQDPSGGVVMLAEPPGADACTRDATTPAPLGQKEFTVGSFADYFLSLGRPAAAGFIFSTAQSSCSGEGCTPGLCLPGGGCGVEPPDVCGGQAAGNRLYAAAHELKGRGVDVVTGSVCDDFGPILNAIAEVVKPPQTLTLPTPPSEGDVTLLRIASAGGETRKLCGRPLAPGSYADLAAAQATGSDWWFTPGTDAAPPASGVTRFVYINPQGSCRANPGETYSAEYLGLVPSPSADNPEGGCANDAECTARLGGTLGSFTCYRNPDPAAGMTRGTCICGSGT